MHRRWTGGSGRRSTSRAARRTSCSITRRRRTWWSSDSQPPASWPWAWPGSAWVWATCAAGCVGVAGGQGPAESELHYARVERPDHLTASAALIRSPISLRSRSEHAADGVVDAPSSTVELCNHEDVVAAFPEGSPQSRAAESSDGLTHRLGRGQAGAPRLAETLLIAVSCPRCLRATEWLR